MSEPERDTEALQHYLAARDTACPGCAYNLRGLTGDRCPECNQPLALGVMLVDGGVLAMSVATAGLAAIGTGAALFLLGITAFSLLRFGWPRGHEFVLLVIVPAIYVVLDAAALRWFVSRRVWFLTLSRERRRQVAWGCWGVSAGGFLLWLCLVLASI